MPARRLLRSTVFVGALLAAFSSASRADADTRELEALLGRPVYAQSRFESAAKQAQDIALAPGAVVVRTGGEIRTHGYRTLAEVLESIVSVQLRYDRTYHYAGVRGSTRPGDYTSRLLVLVDGVRANDPLYDSVALDRDFPIDVSLIDRIEFTPGPGSALYGSNAVAGVINVITRRPGQVAGTELIGDIGSFGNRKASAVWGGTWGDNRLLLGLAAERRPGGDLYFPEYDSPATHHGVAAGQDGERSDKLFVKFNRGGLRATAVLSERTKYIPTGAYEATFNRPMPWMDGFALANLSYDTDWASGHGLTATLSLGRYTFESLGYYDDAAPTLADTPNDAGWLGGELRYRWAGWARHRLTLGVEFQRNFRQYIGYIEPETGARDDMRGDATRYGVFVNDDWQLTPALTLTTGLRIDRRTAYRTNLSPRLAAVWAPLPQWSFKLLAGRAFREPNFNETDYFDSLQRRADHLEVERLQSLEFVALWRPRPSVSLSGSLYRSDMRDVIELMEQDDGLTMFENRGRVRAQGLELEATLVSARGVQLRAGMAWQRAEDAATGVRLTNAASALTKLSLTVPNVLPSTRLGVNAVGMGSRTTLAGARLPFTMTVNAHLTWQPQGRRWHAALGVYNLGDRYSVDPAGPEHRQDTLAQDGREWRLQVGRTF